MAKNRQTGSLDNGPMVLIECLAGREQIVWGER
jgi:hypothetical protein